MEEVILIEKSITRQQLKEIALKRFGDLAKAVVDLEKGVMALGGELHADVEAFLLEGGSNQKDLWGINLYPDLLDDNFIEFDSMINIRPGQNNRSRSVQDPVIRQKIADIIKKLII